MTDVNDIVVRDFRREDRESLRDISCRTAFPGHAFTRFIDDGGILADALTLYFTDYEPESSFVITKGGKVIGYLTGALSARRMRRVFNCRILARLVGEGLKRGLVLRKNTRVFLSQVFLSFLRGEFFAPDFSKEYPAAFHINIDRGFQRQGLGKMLVERYTDFLRENEVSGVHCRTRSEDAGKFFVRLGFNVLYRGEYSYLRYYFKRNFPYYILGKKV